MKQGPALLGLVQLHDAGGAGSRTESKLRDGQILAKTRVRGGRGSQSHFFTDLVPEQ